jgi:hypothetical protein
MTARLALACLLAAAVLVPQRARADKPKDDDTSVSDDDDSDSQPAKKKKKPPADDSDSDGSSDAKSSDDQDDDSGGKPRKRASSEGSADVLKQDLTGHDLGGSKSDNLFEKDRFFVDKVDTRKTQNGTLIQGSLAETSFAYTESGGSNLNGATNDGGDASSLSRLYTELRYQSDFRHIGGGKWDARIDARVRLVDQPSADDKAAYGTVIPATELKAQSGLLGGDEYDLREAYFVRSGARTDVFIGRQFITDLDAVKIDGLRIDYASSKDWTEIGFAGLYPLLGSRSLTTDYLPLQTINPNGTITSDGRFTVAGGGGAAYRYLNAYGAFGAVALAPLAGEEPRIFITSNGYWRFGSQLDFYHFAVIDLIGSNAVNSGITNLSAGVNYKPSPRLRITGSLNHVDTQTLNVQAGAFLDSPSAAGGLNVIDNEVYIQRIATDELRGSIAAGLGKLQRFELVAALAYRDRPQITLTSLNLGTTSNAVLAAEQSVEAYASFTDRHSIFDLRLGVDVIRSFGIGGTAYNHTELFGGRVYAAHDIADGRGELEAEVSYTQTADNDANETNACNAVIDPTSMNFLGLGQCFGSSNADLLSIGANFYYRFNRNWFGLLSGYVTEDSVESAPGGGITAIKDAPILGFTGFLRVAYRF